MNLEAPPEKMRRALEQLGFVFFFAPAYHPTFKHIVPVRRALAARGQRTVFNILGPLINPVPKSRADLTRLDAHRQHFDSPRPEKRAPYRQKLVDRAPRALSDALYEEVFTSLRTNRDRAIVATAMATSNANNPNFLALYGMEWGVISNGGHLNIINGDKLAAWEYNSSNQLLGDLFVAKNDYANLYTTMKARGWVGQFNHPSTSDSQFKIGTTVFGYHADGDEVMVGAEIMKRIGAAGSLFGDSGYDTATTTDKLERILVDGHVKITTVLEVSTRVANIAPNGSASGGRFTSL